MLPNAWKAGKNVLQMFMYRGIWLSWQAP